jgi:phosphatidate cytidylyltransferase
MKRILTALVAVPILVYVIGFTPPVFFTFLVALSTILALEEFFSLAEKSGIETHRAVGHLFSLLLIGSFHQNPHNQSSGLLFLVVAMLLFLFLGLRRGGQFRQTLSSSSTTLLGLIYVPTTLGLLVSVRSSAFLWGDGRWWIFFFLLVVWFGDSGAYYIGRAWGKHKLAPSISPRKTIEGSLGGLVGNTLAAFLGKEIFLPAVPALHLLILSWVLGLVSQSGDLVESVMKRGAGVKDSSNLLPGHGGMLDRIDGVLFGAPVLFCYTKFFLKNL